MSRTVSFVSGTAAGETLSSRTPSPTSSGAATGSAASSPQTATSMPITGRAADLADQPQHPRVERIGQRCDRVVPALGGQRVLREVVRADAEEVDVRRDRPRLERERRHLHHDADLEARRRVAPDRSDRLVEHRPGPDQLVERAHHREHHADRALVRDRDDRR